MFESHVIGGGHVQSVESKCTQQRTLEFETALWSVSLSTGSFDCRFPIIKVCIDTMRLIDDVLILMLCRREVVLLHHLQLFVEFMYICIIIHRLSREMKSDSSITIRAHSHLLWPIMTTPNRPLVETSKLRQSVNARIEQARTDHTSMLFQFCADDAVHHYKDNCSPPLCLKTFGSR